MYWSGSPDVTGISTKTGYMIKHSSIKPAGHAIPIDDAEQVADILGAAVPEEK